MPEIVPIEVRLLGPVEVLTDGDPLPIPSSQCGLLTVLALHANRIVAASRLIDMLWDATPPKDSGHALQIRVSRLRRRLPAWGADDRLAFRPPGYLLRLAPGELDLARFQELADRGRQHLAGGDARQARTLLRQALELWRGPPMEDVTLQSVRREAARLEERRLAALEDRIEADLRCGGHDELIAELEVLVAAQPLRERLWSKLMLALYRAGRQAEALAVFRRLHRLRAGKLGLEPSPAVRELERQILVQDPVLDAPALNGPALVASAGPGMLAVAPPTPRQLPPDIACFTGRKRELVQLDRSLTLTGPGRPVAITAIHGTGGIGKSALAVHAAHRLVDQFPDGQLYVNLQGATAGLQPLPPLEVLGRFLRALGVERGQIPAGLDEAAASFRSLVAARQLLVVLDNARDAAQVRPLLPAGPTCGVLVTSRRMLTGLDSATHLHLDMLSVGEAVALLRKLVGERRVAAELVAVAEVAKWCGCLPLALRIAGGRLAARPGWPVRALTDRLANEQCRLDELDLAEVGVRASFQVSYQELRDSADALDRAAARAFPLLGTLDGPDVGVMATMRLLEEPEDQTGRVLERLVDTQLLEAPAPGRYRLHDLLRLYARELAARHRPESAEATLDRALGLYVAGARDTLALLPPGAQPGSAAAGMAGTAAPVTCSPFGFLLPRDPWQNWKELNHLALGLAPTRSTWRRWLPQAL